MISYRIEVESRSGFLISYKNIIIPFFQFPIFYMFIRTSKISQEFFILTVLIGIFMIGTTQCRSYLSIYIIFFKVNLIITGTGRFMFMTITGIIRLRFHFSTNTNKWNITEIPMSLTSMYKSIFILVTRTTPPHCYGSYLYH